MNPALSIWLDLCRVLAALAVFVGHSRYFGVAPAQVGLAWHRSADDAVTAFFVISGMVIAHTTHSRNSSGRDYVLARASRVYSVALPAVLFVFAIDLLGMRFDASVYDANYQYPKPLEFIAFHGLFLGETWFGSSHPFSMAPYWSLGYEVWYYAWFGCLVYLQGRARSVAATAVLLLMGPRIWLLLPTWWLGVALYRHLDGLRCSRSIGVALMALAIGGYAVFLGSGMRAVTDQASLHLYAAFSEMAPTPFLKGASVHALSDYVVAALFSAFVVGCANCRFEFGPRSARAIRILAGYTFTFYLIHFSLLALGRAFGAGQLSWLAYLATLGAVLATTWALAQVGEQRRGWYRAIFARIWPA